MTSNRLRHLLEVDDLSAAEISRILDLAEVENPAPVLAGRGMALLFEKPSLRTRNATEMAVVQLGGHPLTLRGEEVGLADREPTADVARVLSRYHAAIGARVFDHGHLEEMARWATVPVINLLSDDSHPCQALADMLTLRQHFGRLAGLRVAYVGDFNNVARSLVLAGALCGVEVSVAGPPGFGPNDVDVERAAAAGVDLQVHTHPAEAVKGVDAIYTDVWASMGHEHEAQSRRRSFEGFMIDEALMAEAAPGAVFMHCLPAHRGDEVSAAVVDGDNSLVWKQAGNRMHAMRGLLLWLFGADEPR